MSMKLLGAAALRRSLRGLNDIAEYEPTLTDIVLQIERDAKKNAPVDTGNLRASIESEVRLEGSDTLAGFVGTNTDYAPFVELGTSRMSAQPFLRPAVEENRELIEDELGARIEEMADG